MSDERLAGVQEDLAALDDHALDGQVLPDVLRLADLIVHDPAGSTFTRSFTQSSSVSYPKGFTSDVENNQNIRSNDGA